MGTYRRLASSGFYDFDDFPALVLAAMRASAMRQYFFVTIRALG